MPVRSDCRVEGVSGVEGAADVDEASDLTSRPCVEEESATWSPEAWVGRSSLASPANPRSSTDRSAARCRRARAAGRGCRRGRDRLTQTARRARRRSSRRHASLHQAVGDEQATGVFARVVKAPGAGEREMGQRQRRVALAGLGERAAHVRRGRSVERAAERDRDQRDGALALRRVVATVRRALRRVSSRRRASARRRRTPAAPRRARPSRARPNPRAASRPA